jgi:lincosamide and streptogramin A transport system ATP-binding/permease protein
MTLIRISNLTYGYDNSIEPIFQGVSLQIDTSWKLGLIGRNGRGKTTFLKLLHGQYDFKGTINPMVECDYFPFDDFNKNEKTSIILNRICDDYKLWQVKRELSLLEVSETVIDSPFAKLSNGEQTKVLLAALFLKTNKFLLIDEPTDHLDMDARQVVSQYLKSKEGFILVSHDRTFLDNCIDHVLSINKMNIEIQKGNFSSWQYNKDLQDNFELSKSKKLKKELKRLSSSARRTAGWSNKIEASKTGMGDVDRGYIGHKAAKMMKRSKTVAKRRQKTLEEKAMLTKNIEAADSLYMKPLLYYKNELIEIDNLSIFYGKRQICKNVRFTVNRGDRVVLMGKNGTGKSSILKVILGQRPVYNSQVRIGAGLKISYIPQDTSFLEGTLREFAQKHALNEPLFKAVLDRLGFTESQHEMNMKEFSDGQKKKVYLAGSLCQEAHLYIWDEPLNYIDVISRIQIEDLILRDQPTMLFVEHDYSFVKAITTKQVKLDN